MPKPATAIAIRVPASVRLPDNSQWTNRFEVRSASSNRVYVIAQHKTSRHWGCSCPGWICRRRCKHLANLGLPANSRPFEAKIESR
jgi:hypothetical protein